MMSPSKSPVGWLADLKRASVNLPQEQPPPPYYSQRESNSAGTSELSLASTVSRVRSLVRKFHDDHYFAETLGFECVDVHDTTEGGVGRLLNNRRSARVRSEGTERSNPKTRTVFGTNPHQRPGTPAGANGVGRCPWVGCNGFFV